MQTKKDETRDNSGSQQEQKITSHAVGGVFSRWDGKKLEIAVMNYTKPDRRGERQTTLRVPMGTQGAGKKGKENLNETRVREILQEAAGRSATFEYDFVSVQLPHYEVVPDDKYRGMNVYEAPELHLKAFYALTLKGGELRNYALVEQEGTPDEEILGPLEWIEARELLHRMEMPKASILAHRKAVIGTIALLAMEYSGVAIQYGQLIDEAERKISLEREKFKSLVLQYLEGFEVKVPKE